MPGWLVAIGEIVLQGVVQGLTQTAADWTTKALSWLTKNVTKMLRAQSGLLGWLGDRGAELVENISGALQDNITKSVNTISKMAQKQLGVWRATERHLKDLTKWVGSKFKQVTKWISGQLGPVLNKVGRQLGFTQKTVKQIAERKRGLSSKGVNAFIGYLDNSGTTVVTQAETKQAGIFNWLKKKGQWLGKQITGGFEQSLKWLKEKGVKMAGRIAAFVSGIGQALTNAVLFLLQGMAKLLDVDLEEIDDIYGQLLQNFLPGELGPAEGGEGPPAYRA